jgi:hypothetical protein
MTCLPSPDAYGVVGPNLEKVATTFLAMMSDRKVLQDHIIAGLTHITHITA